MWYGNGCGGTVGLDLLYPVAALRGTSTFFIWDAYQNAERPLIGKADCLEERTPEAIRPYLPEEFQLPLRKELTLPWGPMTG